MIEQWYGSVRDTPLPGFTKPEDDSHVTRFWFDESLRISRKHTDEQLETMDPLEISSMVAEVNDIFITPHGIVPVEIIALSARAMEQTMIRNRIIR